MIITSLNLFISLFIYFFFYSYYIIAALAHGYDSIQKSLFNEVIICNGACATEPLSTACPNITLLTGYQQQHRGKQCNCSTQSHMLNCGLNIKKGEAFNYRSNNYGIKTKGLSDYRPTACIAYHKTNNRKKDRKFKSLNSESFDFNFLVTYSNDNNIADMNKIIKNNNWTNNNLFHINSLIRIDMNSIDNHTRNIDSDEVISNHPFYSMSVNQLSYSSSSTSLNKIGIQSTIIIKREGHIFIGIIKYCDVINSQHESVLVRQIQDESVCLHTYGVKLIVLVRLDSICRTEDSTSSSSPSSLLLLSSSSLKYVKRRSQDILINALEGYIDILLLYNYDVDDFDSYTSGGKDSSEVIPVISINSVNDSKLFLIRKSIRGIQLQYY